MLKYIMLTVSVSTFHTTCPFSLPSMHENEWIFDSPLPWPRCHMLQSLELKQQMADVHCSLLS